MGKKKNFGFGYRCYGCAFDKAYEEQGLMPNVSKLLAMGRGQCPIMK